MTTYHSLSARPSVAPDKRHSYVAFIFSSKMVRVALLILVICLFSACSQAAQSPSYSDATNLAPTGVGTGDIHTLSSGDLMW